MCTSLFKFALAMPLSEASFPRRGFHWRDAAARTHLEHVGGSFLRGYNLGLEDCDGAVLTDGLEKVEHEFRGFAYEGAAMALALLDRLTPWKHTRLQLFIDGPASAHVYMAYVGAGWSLARIPIRAKSPLRKPHPLLRWLQLDGYGFHEGFFHWPKYVRDLCPPRKLKGYAARVFDQGLGRSLWFVAGADVEHIAATIERFPLTRRADLWSGLGLACAYAGGADRAGVEELRRLAGGYEKELAQGAAFAAATRLLAGNLTSNTETACEVLCGVSAAEAASITDAARLALNETESLPAFEVWRQRIQNAFFRESHNYA
jgi:enediyne biosynthesis protein E3